MWRAAESEFVEAVSEGNARSVGHLSPLGEMTVILQLLKEMEDQHERAVAEERAQQREEFEQQEHAVEEAKRV